MDAHNIIDSTEGQDNNRDEEHDRDDAVQEVSPEVPSECPVCRIAPVNPVQINCGHIFCFLCIKGVYETSGHCPMCRAEIGIDFNRREHRVLGTIKLPSSSDGFYWFYEGRRGWWMYDADTCRELEEAHQQNETQIEKILAGEIRVIDLREMKQFPKEEPTRTRRICRETLALANILGLGGLKGEDLKRALDMMRFADDNLLEMFPAKEILKIKLKNLNGFLPVYKPAGWCSHRLGEGLKLDQWYTMEKYGVSYNDVFYTSHAHDLEPFADGLMTFVLGKSKTFRKNFIFANYIYRAKIEFGVEREFTSIDGKVLSKTPAGHITRDLIEKALPQFEGTITQDRNASYSLPPPGDGQIVDPTCDDQISAFKPIDIVNRITLQKPLGSKPKPPQKYPYQSGPRTLLVEKIHLDHFSNSVAELTISCHGRFKVRKFAEDLADLFGTKASVVELSRIKEGPITIDDLRVFQPHELHMDYYIDRLAGLQDLYDEFNEEVDPLWEHVST